MGRFARYLLLLGCLLALPASAQHTWHRYIQGWNHTAFNEDVLLAAALGGLIDTGPIPDCGPSKALQGGDGTCIDTLIELNAAGSWNLDDGPHTPDQVGLVTLNNICRGDGSQVVCNLADVSDINAVLTLSGTGLYEFNTVTTQNLCYANGSLIDCTIDSVGELEGFVGGIVDPTELAAAVADYVPIAGDVTITGPIRHADQLILEDEFILEKEPADITAFSEGTVGDGVVQVTVLETHGLSDTPVTIDSFEDGVVSDGIVIARGSQVPDPGQWIVIEGTTNYDGENNAIWAGGAIIGWADGGGGLTTITYTISNYVVQNGETVVVTGTESNDGTYTTSAAAGATFKIDTSSYVAESCPGGSCGVFRSESAFGITETWTSDETPATWTLGVPLVIRGSTHYDGEFAAHNFGSTTFDIVHTWDGDDCSGGCTATYTATPRFAVGDATPDVRGNNFFETSDYDGTQIFDFDWGTGEPTSAGQTIMVRSLAATTFMCFDLVQTSYLKCGPTNLKTVRGDTTIWRSEWRTGSGSEIWWNLLSYTDQSEPQQGPFLPEEGPRTLGTTHLGDVELNKELWISRAKYFADGDTTPDVTGSTVWFSWQCADTYVKHCADNYSSRNGWPCGDSDVQCSGSPDNFCDSDGVTASNAAPQRVDCDDIYDSPAATTQYYCADSTQQTCPDTNCDDDGTTPVGTADGYCDADGTTLLASGTTAAGVTVITDFDGGSDRQLIIVQSLSEPGANGGVNKPAAIQFDCTQPTLQCGSTPIPGGGPSEEYASRTVWYYDAPTDTWNLIAYENFSSANKASYDWEQTWTADQTFDTANIYGTNPNYIFSWAGPVVLDETLDLGGWDAWGADTTPDVDGSVLYEADTPGTITALNAMVTGQPIIVYTSVDGVVFDCDGASIDCGTVDITTDTGDVTFWIRTPGSPSRRLVSWFDASQDLTLSWVAPLASPTFTGVVETDDLVVEGVHSRGTMETFAAADCTPSVATGDVWTTPWTGACSEITDFDDATDQQKIYLYGGTGGAGFLIDCDSGTQFDCGTVDIRVHYEDLISFQYSSTTGLWHLAGWYDGDKPFTSNFLGTNLSSSLGTITALSSVYDMVFCAYNGFAECWKFEGEFENEIRISPTTGATKWDFNGFDVYADTFYSDDGAVHGLALSECFPIYAPTAEIQDTYDIDTLWRANSALTISKVWCETDTGTVNADLQIDDGTPADVMGTDLVCASTAVEDSSGLTGSMAAGDRLDLEITSVASNPTRLTFCIEYAYD